MVIWICEGFLEKSIVSELGDFRVGFMATAGTGYLPPDCRVTDCPFNSEEGDCGENRRRVTFVNKQQVTDFGREFE